MSTDNLGQPVADHSTDKPRTWTRPGRAPSGEKYAPVALLDGEIEPGVIGVDSTDSAGLDPADARSEDTGERPQPAGAPPVRGDGPPAPTDPGTAPAPTVAPAGSSWT